MIVISRTLTIPDEELQWSFARSSGPGGQNVNKVNSKAILHWSVTTSSALPVDVRERFLTKYASRITEKGHIVLSSQLHRDQPKNIAACEQRLKALVLAVLIPPKKRRPTKPTKSSQRERLDNKKQHSTKKENRRWSGE
jgi:ribosome-associated protein